MRSRLLAGRAWRGGIHEYSDAPGGAQALEQIVRAVAADETAIGYSGFAYAVPGAKALALARISLQRSSPPSCRRPRTIEPSISTVNNAG